MASPVIQHASSDARKTAGGAISFGCPTHDKWLRPAKIARKKLCQIIRKVTSSELALVLRITPHNLRSERLWTCASPSGEVGGKQGMVIDCIHKSLEGR
jgi:hypothetical protein